MRWPSSASCRRAPPRPSGTRRRTRPSTSRASTRSSARPSMTCIAFLTHLAEIVGPEARFVHQGMTSSDVLDTCFNVQLVRADRHPDHRRRRLLAALKRRALEHKMTPTHRPLARHPCRAHDVRPEARACLCRVRPRQAAADRGAQGSRHLRDLRRRRHLRQHRSARRRTCRQEDGPRGRSRSRPR